MVLDVLLCGVGFILLYYGAEWLVKGSSEFARSLGIRPIVIGLTVVAFGTSAPELMVSVSANLGGAPDLSVGNVFGSNICNIALVLGLAATLQRITCDRIAVKRDIPIMLGISLVVIALLLNDELSRIEGGILFAGIIAYTYMNYRFGNRDEVVATLPDAEAEALITRNQALLVGGVCILPAILFFSRGEIARAWFSTGMVLVGALAFDMPRLFRSSSRLALVTLIVAGGYGVGLGGDVVVEAAKRVMFALGVDGAFVGLTVAAFGTSLPELATSVVAAARKQMDISIGNLVGSNVFNLLSVLGATALVRPIVLEESFLTSSLVIAAGVMILTSALPWIMMQRSSTVGRKRGLTLLTCYAGFVAYLILNA